ncbi:MAG: diphthine synthase [Candidatus Micrarchaeota archaeon]|nr:diphthine synthase [Candidatus Micrarchaeota archaeon]
MGKGSLALVGIGTADERGISLSGLEQLRHSDAVFAESYTNLMPQGTLERLEKLCGKKIELLSREQVEGEKRLLEACEGKDVSLVVAGDPMIATTHVSLLISAKRKGIATGIVHAASILSAAIGESGLQAYKFGKIVTLAYWRENYRPMAAYEVIGENLARGLHTLLLLDIDEKLGPMSPKIAAETLVGMEETGGKKLLLPQTKLVLLAGIGWETPVRKYRALGELPEFKMKGCGPAVLIVPGKLHFVEEEYLELLG